MVSLVCLSQYIRIYWVGSATNLKQTTIYSNNKYQLESNLLQKYSFQNVQILYEHLEPLLGSSDFIRFVALKSCFGTRLSGTRWPGCPGGMKYKDRWLGGDLPGGNVLDPWQLGIFRNWLNQTSRQETQKNTTIRNQSIMN